MSDLRTTVREVCESILALSSEDRYRLASHLFQRNEAQLAHLVIRSGVVDDAASFDLDEDPVVLPEVAA